jgi:hypothetical protein
VSLFYPPVLTAPTEISAAFESICTAPDALNTLEKAARENDLSELPLISSREWLSFSADVGELFASRDHVIIKGLPVSQDGSSLLLAARLIGSLFRTYRGGQIIKHFKMSPWTKELSHTTREGEFHTDLNAEPTPPAITAMQCLDPDPGAPKYGINRIARMIDLLSALEDANDEETLNFLTRETVTMLNDRSSSDWSGRIVEGRLIRYHPETLRAAARRAGLPLQPLEERIACVAQAALSVSEPFNLDRGDVLLLSNHRALHYRGECSVVFERFPTEFTSRSVFILHTNRELKDS